ncbi:hypothetical protein QQF64_031406 [Cirrhinus molitorella]|uniref:Uncharacterized protein n=1 Tax=Cirrhinus molitorella TaxID=172907 RepID=A0ABR3MWW1_9TELE
MRRRKAGQGGGWVCGLNQFAATPSTNVDSGCITMARRQAVVQTFKFDPESDPHGEAPDEEVVTQWLQQDVSECKPPALPSDWPPASLKTPLLSRPRWQLGLQYQNLCKWIQIASHKRNELDA